MYIGRGLMIVEFETGLPSGVIMGDEAVRR